MEFELAVLSISRQYKLGLEKQGVDKFSFFYHSALITFYQNVSFLAQTVRYIQCFEDNSTKDE